VDPDNVYGSAEDVYDDYPDAAYEKIYYIAVPGPEGPPG